MSSLDRSRETGPAPVGTASMQRALDDRQGPAAFTWSRAQADASALVTTRHPAGLLPGAIGLLDALVVAASSGLAYLLRNGVAPASGEILTSTMLAVVLTINALQIGGTYTKNVTDNFVVQIGRVVHAWTLVFVCLVILGYLTKTSGEYSRIWAVTWYSSALIGFALVRLLAVSQVQRWRRSGQLARTVAIVDLAGTGTELARRLQQGGAKVRLAGVFLLRPGPGRQNGIDNLIALSRLFRIDEVLVTVSGGGGGEVDAVLRRLGTIPANVRLCPALPDLAASPVQGAGMFLDVMVLTVHRRPLGDWSGVLKRFEDLLLGTAMLLLLAPVMAMVAIAVKLDSPGPVLFCQARLGFNNNVIKVFKFRSMRHVDNPGGDVKQAQRGDSRVTRVGRFLRRSSLDELPQLFNVLRGDMSLVGPRPHALAHNEQYAELIDDYLGRHRVQPGITGWAQVHGFRGETDTLDKMQGRVKYDLVYIERWSVLLDLKIIFLTVISAVFDNKHVY